MVKVFPLIPVYLITSSPIWIYPGLVALTGRPSKEVNAVPAWTDKSVVSVKPNISLQAVGVISLSTSSIVTWLTLLYIPWFLWWIFKWYPSSTTETAFGIALPLTEVPPFNWVDSPTLSIYQSWEAVPVTSKSPCTSVITNSLNADIPDSVWPTPYTSSLWPITVNLKPSPTWAPTVPRSAVRTSPTWYPVPPLPTPLVIPAPTICPSETVTKPTAPDPLPVTDVKLTFWK